MPTLYGKQMDKMFSVDGCANGVVTRYLEEMPMDMFVRRVHVKIAPQIGQENFF
jgi:hypothetical protein